MRRASHGNVRAAERTYLHEITRDPDVADAQAEPRLEQAHRDFADKLGPVRRWLRSHCGRPWDKVYAELRERFDTRTTPGRHIIEDHVLRDVRGGWLFRIDERGFLRVREARAYTRWRWTPPMDAATAAEFAGRRVGARGTRLYWFLATWAGDEPTGRFRQDRELTPVETARWRELPDEWRQALTWPARA